MPRFFVPSDRITDTTVTITGDDAFHISRSLRMAAGERITVCDMQGHEFDCRLVGFGTDVTAEIISVSDSLTEPPFSATVWQALPKGDKLDTVIQKSVECGASGIALFESAHCIVRYDRASDAKKSERRARIAAEAAKQSGRGIIPSVASPVSFDEMLRRASSADLPLFCYEAGGTLPLGRLFGQIDLPERPTGSIVVGPEGGFSPDEAERAEKAGFLMAGLGPRILRTETVAAFVLGALVCRFELV